ncbi:MAG: carbon-nitrogen hydrolase [Planctomycetota bacterium]
MGRSVKLTLVQMPDAGTQDRCLDAAADWIRAAAKDDAHIVCLQELFRGPYPCQTEDHRNFDLAEAIEGPSFQAFSAIAKQHDLVIVAPIFERRAPGVYHNTAIVIDADGSLAGIYRKMHIPDDPLFYEKFYFTPGDLGFTPIETRYAKLGIGICWDQWFPETARLLCLAGAEILLYPTAIGWIDEEKHEFGTAQHDAWETTMRAHAISNGVWVGAANRVGIEDRLEFWGQSFIASPTGEIVAKADAATPGLLSTECRLDDSDLVRTHWPFLRDRRIDSYQGLLRRWID